MDWGLGCSKNPRGPGGVIDIMAVKICCGGFVLQAGMAVFPVKFKAFPIGDPLKFAENCQELNWVQYVLKLLVDVADELIDHG